MEERPSSVPSSIADRNRRRWHFGRAVLDERTHELIVDGVDAELERKPLEVLLYLLQHAGEVCTKDELLEGVWPGRILSETVLTKSIGRLREVLGDQNQEVIKTAYGFGYRFIAAVRVESAPAVEPAHFNLQPGGHPPLRPLWSLVERLGVGGHGEAWRARHDKTNEQRVFKFALDEFSLSALKREITLFRVINDTLGESAHVVKLLDWNLEQAPYFLEAEYQPGGSLDVWARARGGAGAISVSDRLEIVAKIAESLGAVHSVGVLHKDLKPSNVLVKLTPTGSVEVLLADFGSGGLTDAHRIDVLGITRLGFTKTISAGESSSATPMYLAPEILTGQPFTVKSDLYALGVMCYQFMAGDFHKLMSPGWERDIKDELLREDIALMAEGDPAKRISDAEGIARRLRSLDERRRQVALEREARSRSERSRQLAERARARRFGLALAFAALAAGLVISTTLYFKTLKAQAQTELAAKRSKAVTEFLSKDVFAPVSSGAESVKDLRVSDLLTRAGNEIDARFAAQPDIASELHYVIGRSFNELYEYPLSVRHFNRAMEIGRQLDGEGADSVLRSASELIDIDFSLGHLRETMPRYEAALAVGTKLASPDAPTLIELRQRIARGHYRLGDWQRAAQELADLLNTVRTQPATSPALIGLTEFYLGQVLTELAKPIEAQTELRNAIEHLASSVGSSHAKVAEAHAALGRALADAGQFNEASAELDQAQQLADKWAPPDTWTFMRPRYFRGLMLLQQDQPAKAAATLAQIVDFQEAHFATYLAAHQGSEPELDHTGPVRQALGEAYAREGKLGDAITVLQRALEVSERADGPDHPDTISTRLSLAENLLAAGRDHDARRLLEAISSVAMANLPAMHPIVAQQSRVAGLLAQLDGNLGAARDALRNSFQIYSHCYGSTNWRVVRARQDYQRVAGKEA
jgi:eukaryotic-like serine/threonine-protein kinase